MANQLQETSLGCMAKLVTSPAPSSAPQTYSQIQQFLLEKDVNRIVTINHDLDITWTSELTNSMDIPQIIEDLVKYLDEKGHGECTMMVISDRQLRWCKQDSCPESGSWDMIEKKTKEIRDLAAKLRSEGHTCVSMGQRMPPDISWCESEPCLNC